MANWGSASQDRARGGQWVVRTNVFGKIRLERLPKTIKTRRQAEALIDGIIARRVAAEGDASQVMTFSRFIPEWHRVYARRVETGERSDRTLEGYLDALRKHVEPVIGDVPLEELSTRHVFQIHEAMYDKGLSPRTVQHAQASLGVVLKLALQQELVTRNVAHIVDSPKSMAAAGVAQAMTVEDLRKVLDAAAADANIGRALAFFISLGLRRSDVCGLTWDDIEAIDVPGGGIMHVRKTVRRVRGQGTQIKPQKTRASRRSLPLTAQMMDLLAEHRAVQDERRRQLGPLWEGTAPKLGVDIPLVFPGPYGRPRTEESMSKLWPMLCKRAGVPRTRLHDARHTAMTLLMEAGVDPSVRKAWIGHSTDRMADHYTHVSVAALQPGADALDRLLAPAVGG